MSSTTPAEAERLFIGALLHRPEKLIECKVSKKHFTSSQLARAFDEIQAMELENQVIDVVSLSQRLEQKTGRSWMAMLGECQMDSFSETFFQTSQLVMIDAYRRREMSRIAADLGKEYNPDKAIRELMEIEQTEKKFTHTLPEAAIAAIEKAQEYARRDGVPGLTTGLARLDEVIGGFQAPDLYVLGARPAMGKTSVALNFMLAHKVPVAFFSTEQPHDQIGLRAIAATSGVSAKAMRTATFDPAESERMYGAVTQLTQQQIYINDNGVITISELMREARRMKYNHDIQAVYVDYIQRIRSGNTDRRLEVSEVVTGLKSLAKELEIPVIALAQVSRTVESRNDRRPRMGDLLESGVIEQEADVVMMLYRDEVYDASTPDKGIIELALAKNRHGQVGILKFAWLAETMQIKNLETREYA